MMIDKLLDRKAIRTIFTRHDLTGAPVGYEGDKASGQADCGRLFCPTGRATDA